MLYKWLEKGHINLKPRISYNCFFTQGEPIHMSEQEAQGLGALLDKMEDIMTT